jgi:serine/threonine-protein kinase
MKQGFWRQEWFAGLIISVLFLAIADSDLIRGLEYAAYDWGVRHTERDPGKKIEIIAIDDQSIENLGRWPWSRDLLAGMLDKLAESGAKVIGNTILLSEQQKNPGLPYIEDALTKLKQANLSNPVVAEVITKLLKGKTELDTDQRLSDSMAKTGNVAMGIQFQLGTPLGKPDAELPDYISRNIITQTKTETTYGAPYPAISATPPIPVLGEQAASLGHLIQLKDQDGGIRSELLAVDYYGQIYPSLALMVAAQSLNLGPKDIRVEPGKGVALGNLYIKTDAISRMYPFYYQNEDGSTPFSVNSFYDVQVGNIEPAKYKDKIVLIGATATGIGENFVTPVSGAMQSVLVFANIIASILNQDFFVTPEWAGLAETGVFFLIALFLILLLPRLSAGMAAGLSALLFIVLLSISQFMLISYTIWLQPMLPATLLVCGYLLLITRRYLVTERGKLRSDQESAESYKTLGLAYQQQGQLDMALDKFNKCPLDDSMMDPLYNLALDFERKRQFNKASSVYEYMAEYNADYKDLRERIKRSKAVQDTFMFGAAGTGPTASLVLGSDGVEKPKLGRYEVEKELGKGAMGVVYLGKDPTINRVVAIKTLALAQEFEEDELEEVKSRFFREAETAGRLTHPNIVTIYDAGAEHDLAYIAMEFLSGHDLMRYTKADKLLPITNVIKIIILAAEALNYAHQQNVVHRDIKPANVMFVPESSTIKLTDFGIARITDSSKTKTGMVLGTPSYMSPEQLSGKKIDGRSDLFSLGVMLYQLLSGELPFSGDSMATLMFKIANDPHPEVTSVRPDLSQKAPCVMPIIDKALEKDPENRYQTGHDIVADLRRCLKLIRNK